MGQLPKFNTENEDLSLRLMIHFNVKFMQQSTEMGKE